MKSPHILLITNNVNKVKQNLIGILPQPTIDLIDEEIKNNVKLLFKLGYSHYTFAKSLHNRVWRQKVSRFYYACHNVSRSVRLCSNGDYGMDVEDHRKNSDLPDKFPKRAMYGHKLPNLRTDRNLADYNHVAKIKDLLMNMDEIEELTSEFVNDSRAFLKSKGINI